MFSIPSQAHPGESLAPTAASPTSPTGTSEDFAREHLGEAPLHTLPPTLPTPTSSTDNPGESRLQSAQFRLHSPGFLDYPLVQEQYKLHGPGFLDKHRGQEKKAQLPAANYPPPPTARRASRRRTVIQSPGRGSTRPRVSKYPQSQTEVPEPTMTTPDMASLQADELIKLIEILQCLAASRTEGTPTPTTPQRPPIPATSAGEE